MIKKVEGDLLDDAHEFNVIIHGCNCFNTMRSGVAKQIVQKYPEAKEADNLTKKGDESKLGDISVGAVRIGENPLFIVNAYTQYNFGKDGTRYASYNAIREALKRTADVLLKGNEYKVGLPQIGAGLGGGDWDIIEKIIRDELRDYDVTVITYKPN